MLLYGAGKIEINLNDPNFNIQSCFGHPPAQSAFDTAGRFDN
jgi:hypothetical protein